MTRFTGRPNPRLWVVIVVLLAPARLLAGEPVVITSTSQQITVRGPNLGAVKDTAPEGSSLLLLDPTLLAVSAENVRQVLGRELGWGTEWRGRIFIEIHPVRSQEERILVHSIRSPNGWNYQLLMPDEVDSFRLARALVEVLLMEYANRAAGEQAAEFPPWLAPGLTAHLLAGPLEGALLAPNRVVSRLRIRYDPVQQIRTRLGANAPLTMDQLNWPEPEQFEGSGLDQYDGSAHLLVRELLRLRGGAACLREMLAILPQHLNWQTSFLIAFQQHFPRLIDLEKWWSLALAGFLDRDPDKSWTRPESLQRLDEILYTPVQVRLQEDEMPHDSQVSLQTVLLEWNDPQRLPLFRQKVTQLQAAKPRLAPDAASLAEDYRKVLEQYLQAHAQLAPDPDAAEAAPPSVSPGRALRALKALDLRRQRLWSEPPPKASTGRGSSTPAPPKPSTARPSPGRQSATSGQAGGLK